MNWKKFLSIKHQHLCPHHHYQMTVILTYFFSFFILFPFYLLLDELKLDKNVWQWFFFVPWTIIYILYNLKQRAKIKDTERIEPLKRPIIHWIILGITITALLIQPINLEGRMIILDYSFIIFTLFVADGYWDFKNGDLKIFKIKK